MSRDVTDTLLALSESQALVDGEREALQLAVWMIRNLRREIARLQRELEDDAE